MTPLVVGSYLRPEQLGTVLTGLAALPDGYRPTHYGNRERSAPAANKLSNTEKYRKFVEVNSRGHFLFAERCRYDLTMRFLSGYATLFVEPLVLSFDDNGARSIFECFSSVGTDFHFACQTSEYHRRNRLVTQLGESRVEAWVGRDLARYLPGIYWLTGVGGEVASRLQLESLATDFPGAMVSSAAAARVTLEMPGRSSEWGTWVNLVTEFNQRHSGIFGIETVLSTISRAPHDYATLSTELAKWP